MQVGLESSVACLYIIRFYPLFQSYCFLSIRNVPLKPEEIIKKLSYKEWRGSLVGGKRSRKGTSSCCNKQRAERFDCLEEPENAN